MGEDGSVKFTANATEIRLSGILPCGHTTAEFANIPHQELGHFWYVVACNTVAHNVCIGKKRAKRNRYGATNDGFHFKPLKFL